jgi:hypothetical protein
MKVIHFTYVADKEIMKEITNRALDIDAESSRILRAVYSHDGPMCASNPATIVPTDKSDPLNSRKDDASN